MTREDIIKSASRWASLGNVPAEALTLYVQDYEDILTELLERHRWLFSFDILEEGDLVETSPERNLGFKKTYSLPTRVLNVLDTSNEDASQYSDLSDERAFRIGIALDPGPQRFRGTSRRQYVYVDEQLHINTKPPKTLVQIRPPERSFSGPFREMVKFSMAAYLASSVKNDDRKAAEMNRKAKDQLVIALGRNNAPQDSREYLIYEWLKKFYRGSYY